jgi:hypothetical protein
MKSYISRKLPLETRTTDHIFAFRSAALSGSGARLVITSPSVSQILVDISNAEINE